MQRVIHNVFITFLTICLLLTFITSCGNKDGRGSETVSDSIYTKAYVNQIAVNYAKRAYQDNKGSGDTLTTFNILKMLTALSYDSKSYSEALQYADAGLQLARKVNDMEAEAYFMQFCGFTKAGIGSVDEAIGCLDRSIYLYKEVARKGPDLKKWNKKNISCINNTRSY